MKIKIILILIVLLTLLFLYLYNQKETFTVKEKQTEYEKLMDNFYTIFPSRNRNCGGPQFFKYIVDLNLTKKHFELYNTFYCGVSGSPIDPNRKKIWDYLVVKDLNGNDVIGKYYRCCWPCLCDVMKYARVDDYVAKLKDGEKTYKVLTIKDPCCNETKIPKEVESFTCENKQTKNGIYSKNKRLIFAVFHEPILNPTEQDYEKVKNQLDICKDRMATAPNDLQGGMGDLFVKLSLICDSQTGGDANTELKNIYGEPLQKCRKYNEDQNGSWDQDGYCSEKGGGVHQICFDVTDKNKNFSSATGQSGWSEERVGKNHCMCLGAWALYKARQDKDEIPFTENELNCEAIPEMSLNESYVQNWNTWNGNELPDQVVNGVDNLVKQCYNKKPNEYLKKKYDTLRTSYGNWESVL